MNQNIAVPRINSIAIILIIAFVLNIIATPLLTPYFSMIFNAEDYGTFKISK